MLDHALDRVLAGEVRHIDILRALENRQINNAFDARLPRDAQGLQRLCQFVRGVGSQQEQRADSVHCAPHCVDVGTGRP